MREVHAWLDSKPYAKTLRVSYHEVLRGPKDISRKIAVFLEMNLSQDAMTRQADPTLYRNRKPE